MDLELEMRMDNSLKDIAIKKLGELSHLWHLPFDFPQSPKKQSAFLTQHIETPTIRVVSSNNITIIDQSPKISVKTNIVQVSPIHYMSLLKTRSKTALQNV